MAQKKVLVESQGESGARNQEELDELYVKTAQMKIKHLLEVIERQQDTFSSISVQFETLEEGVSRKDDELNKMIEKLSGELKIGEEDSDRLSAPMSSISELSKLHSQPETSSQQQESQMEKKKKLEKENTRLAQENQVLMEQLERVTNTAASNRNVLSRDGGQ